jgi:hypothetical protein
MNVVIRSYPSSRIQGVFEVEVLPPTRDSTRRSKEFQPKSPQQNVYGNEDIVHFFIIVRSAYSPNQEVDMTCVCFQHLTAVHGATNI